MPLPPPPSVALPVRWTWLPRQAARPAEAQVRDWLASELGAPAASLPLRRDAWRRPWVDAPFEQRDVSWSHSGDGLLVALGQQVRVGIDLERRRPRPRALALAARYFDPAEHAWLATLHEPLAREQAFLRLWCAKEAVLKAHGRGIAFGLDRLRFEEGPGGLRLVESHPDLGSPERWALRELVPAPGYLGAVAWRREA